MLMRSRPLNCQVGGVFIPQLLQYLYHSSRLSGHTYLIFCMILTVLLEHIYGLLQEILACFTRLI
jgi:hypothetical protein